tara:strand:+ start:991 stop:1434 length:444 start_codon:yes stop_codon:yes gene_type:complete
MKAQTRPPAVIFERRPRGTTGKSAAFVVMLPHNYPAKMLTHELHHVKQWWTVTILSATVIFALASFAPFISYYAMFLSVGVMGALYRFAAWFRFRAEASAYAAGFTDEPNELGEYANALSSSLYSTGKTFDECKRAIALRLYTGKLF